VFTDPLDALLFFSVTTPLVGWIGYQIGHVKIRELYAIAGLIVSALLLVVLSDGVQKSKVVVVTIKSFLPPLGVCLTVDSLGIFMAAIYILLATAAAIFSIRYMEHDTGLTEYYTLLLVMAAGMIGVVFAGDFFTLFVFWELMCISSYVLVAFRKQRWEPVEAGFKYLVMSASGTATILFAMSILYGMTGTLNFAYLSTSLATAPPNHWLYLSLAMVIIGFGVKASMAPLHTWLPDAHPAAPSPISALLSGVVIKSGAYGMIRVLLLIFAPSNYQWQMVLAIFAVLTMFVGNLMALLQDDVKRLLAYSSVAQMGYVLFGLAIGTLYGLTGAVFHILNHAIMKGLLFLCVGAFIYRSETRSLGELAGIGRKMPLTAVIFTIGALAIAGVPPLNGFMSEFIIVMAGIQGGMMVFSALMIVNILFSVGYYLRIIQIIVLKEPTEKVTIAKEAPIEMLLPMIVLGVLCVLIGIYPDPFVAFAGKAASAALNTQIFIHAITGK
jgi:proton-translocating NADH-quinone oxidoreductase chain M